MQVIMAVGAALMLGALHGWLLGKQAGRTESELAADDYQSLVEARDRRIAELHVKAEDSAARCDLLQQGIAERAESVETLTARVAAQADRIDRANRDAINMRARFDDQLSQRDGRIEQLRELHANAASLASSTAPPTSCSLCGRAPRRPSCRRPRAKTPCGCAISESRH